MPSRTPLRRTTSRSTTPSAVSGIGIAIRNSDSERCEALHVPPLVDQAASPHLADFVDAVGELVAAILDMNRRVAMRQIASVHIGDARHVIPQARC